MGEAVTEMSEDAVVVRAQREMVARCGEDATVRHLERVSLKLGEVAGARCIAPLST